MWSIGAVVGGTMGAAAVGLGVAVELHLAVAAALFATAALVASRFLLRGPDTRRRRTASGCGWRTACSPSA